MIVKSKLWPSSTPIPFHICTAYLLSQSIIFHSFHMPEATEHALPYFNTDTFFRPTTLYLTTLFSTLSASVTPQILCRARISTAFILFSCALYHRSASFKISSYNLPIGHSYLDYNLYSNQKRVRKSLKTSMRENRTLKLFTNN